mmetsp:Transcript_66977/g.131879  ORF Transcript_66977/g.131879 Transcript_66977/m.131879 type:complete len:264 (-) Transcript_66977:357-1148(-)
MQKYLVDGASAPWSRIGTCASAHLRASQTAPWQASTSEAEPLDNTPHVKPAEGRATSAKAAQSFGVDMPTGRRLARGDGTANIDENLRGPLAGLECAWLGHGADFTDEPAAGGRGTPDGQHEIAASARCRTPSPVLIYSPASRASALFPELMLEQGAVPAEFIITASTIADMFGRAGAGACLAFAANGSPMPSCGEHFGGGELVGHQEAHEDGAEGGGGGSEPAAKGRQRQHVRMGQLFPLARRKKTMKMILREEAEAAARGR